MLTSTTIINITPKDVYYRDNDLLMLVPSISTPFALILVNCCVRRKRIIIHILYRRRRRLVGISIAPESQAIIFNNIRFEGVGWMHSTNGLLPPIK